MREWLVIESARARAVFAGPEDRVKGYIPRDVAEPLLGRKIAEDGDVEWFNSDESELMHNHPEWRDTEPPHLTPWQRLVAAFRSFGAPAVRGPSAAGATTPPLPIRGREGK